jgi:hypothetical protein
MLADPGASGEGGGDGDGGGGSAGGGDEGSRAPDPASPDPEPDENSPLASSSDLNPPKAPATFPSLPTASPCSSARNNALLEAVCTEVWAVSHVEVTGAHDASARFAPAPALLNSLDSAEAGSEPGSSEHSGRRSGASTMLANARRHVGVGPPHNRIRFGGMGRDNQGI